MGVRKPKLYRFFDTKNDLYRGHPRALGGDAGESPVGTLNIYEDSGGQIVRRLVSELADAHRGAPNVVQFLATSQYLSATGDTEHPADRARRRRPCFRVAEELLRLHSATTANSSWSYLCSG